jgi:hypothetical protein
MDALPPIPSQILRDGKVISLRPHAPIVEHGGEHWKSALDCLKELVNDIETGRINAPTAVYVAMQTAHPEKPQYKSYPSYCWSGEQTNGLFMLGLLTKHTYKVANP